VIPQSLVKLIDWRISRKKGADFSAEPSFSPAVAAARSVQTSGVHRPAFLRG
jgi:hypothetical protein